MIDCHAHLVSDDKTTYPPAPPGGLLPPMAFDNLMTAETLLEEMDKSGVERAVLVQRGSIYGFDSRYVCDSAARYPQRFAAVCSIDATQADCGEAVRYWVGEHGAVGIRLMELIKGSDIAWLDSPVARDAWQAAATLDVPVCVHFFPWNRDIGLARLERILREVPGLTVVIDHLGSIQSDAGGPDHGIDDRLRSIAQFDNVVVKFTTIPLGRLDKAGIDPCPVIERVCDLFGAERMIWGSDITQSPGSYDYMAALGRAAVRNLTAAQQEMILGGTAMRVYGKSWGKA
ncbi:MULTISPECIES: amidohydrolase family protein [Sphingobium]|uniref:amidohydrolase family protein n=1 Tax=Sphingobium TaxID=165695 RepID=UPI0015ECCB6C|nr:MULTISPECIES: amidohydrolase family protein [Sphingobium]MCW2361284.1 putative TIM-barrel fold metal-dependent hydrolase [Sphingobium sp. B10D3B]MCW2402037.1 putative TIM-barrel fold metal-dependent hydrolase [Sphingobium sp. B10D7B]MCW2409016.1 putative TIM-barrel fold metal-dependent hydrolase [Sphingobium xanthum]